MQVFQLPLGNTYPSYTFRTDIQGVIYTMFIRYNTRMDRWFLDLLDASKNPIILGLPILLRVPLFNRYKDVAIPSAAFLAYDNTGKDQQPTRYSFGTTHVLLDVEP